MFLLIILSGIPQMVNFDNWYLGQFKKSKRPIKRVVWSIFG